MSGSDTPFCCSKFNSFLLNLEEHKLYPWPTSSYNLTSVHLLHSMVPFSPKYGDTVLLNFYKTTQDHSRSILDYIHCSLCLENFPQLLTKLTWYYGGLQSPPWADYSMPLLPLELYPDSIPCFVFCITVNTTWVYLSSFFLIPNCFYNHSPSLKLMVKWTRVLSNVNSQHLKLHLANSQGSINIYLVLL